ncbi:MAG: AbrB/MazE/SpoVT family DNA-binding domain-containing protein [Nitrospira sp.]
MKTTAQKWGNSLAIRVPKSVAVQVGLKAQDALDIEVQDGNVVLKPHLQRVYRLEDLVKQITPKNMHGEIDTGIPVGREIW